MNMKVKTIFLSLMAILAVMPQTAAAQNLDSLLSEAVSNNPRLKALSERTKSAQYRAESFNSYPAPTLGVEFADVPAGKFNIVNDAMSNRVSISQMFMIGGKVSAMTESERRSAAVEADNYQIYRVNLTGQIKMSYYTLWLTERKIEVQKKNIELYERLINFLINNYAVNRASQVDILTLKGEIASSQTQLVTLQRELEAERYNMNRLLGRELSSMEITTEKELQHDSLMVSQEELEARLSKVNPSLRQMNSMVEMNKAMILANNKERIPDLMLQAMIMRQPQGMPLTTKTDLEMLSMEEPKTEYMYSLMASITLPFAPWASKKYDSRQEELTTGIRAVEYEKNDMQREMSAQLKKSLTKFRASEDLLELYSGSVIPLYEQAAQAQLTAYQSNQTTISTIVDTYRMLLMQLMNYYMAQADARMSLAEIEMMVGGSIK